MNSLDDYAALRPDVDPIDNAGLDRLWAEIVAPNDAVGNSPGARPAATLFETGDDAPGGLTFDFAEDRRTAPTRTGRRRLAVLGAAAAVLLGVVGSIVLLSGRSSTPDPLVDQPDISTPVVGLVASTSPVAAELGTVPQWRITEPGWQLTEFEETSKYPENADVWAAVRADGAAVGWVLVYPTALGVAAPIPEPEGRPIDLLFGVGVGPEPSDASNLTMNWGGFAQAEASQAARVARGRDSVQSTFGYEALDASGAFDMTRTWRYVFTGPEGQVLRVEVRGGGAPYYDDFGAMIPPQPLETTDGIDADALLLLGNGTRIARTGFWVTTIEPVDPPDSVDRAVELTGLVELVPEVERIEAEIAAEPETVEAVTVSADVLGARPEWTIDAAGWTSRVDNEGGVFDTAPIDGLRFFVLEESPDQSWVAVFPTDPSDEIPPTAAETDEGEAGASLQIIERGDGFSRVSSGGIDDTTAVMIADAGLDGAALPLGFVEIEPEGLEAVANLTRTEFDGPDGATITVDVEAGGVPNYVGQIALFRTEPDIDRAGVDASGVQFIGGTPSVIARTGFWISTITVSGAPTEEFEDLASLVQLAGSERSPAASAIDRLAIGDSVMVGAAAQLAEIGFVVDAEQSRSFVQGLDVIRTLEQQDRLPDTLVVHLGGNGTIGEANMQTFVDLVADVNVVVFLTSAIDIDLIDSNNELIVATAAATENIQFLAWDELAASCLGDCLYADGIHLMPDGREYYAALIAALVEGDS